MTAVTPTAMQVGNRLYDLANLDPARCEPELLIPQLAMLPRFQGQTVIRAPQTRLTRNRQADRPFTVLHHTALVIALLERAGHTPQSAPALFIAAVLHDAAEVFTGDIPTPFKRMLAPQALEDAEWPITAAIMAAGGLSEDEATEMLEGDALRTADRQAGAAEAAMFMPMCPGTREYWARESSVDARLAASAISRGTIAGHTVRLLGLIEAAREHLPEWRDRRREPASAYASGAFPTAWRVDVPAPRGGLTPAQAAE